MSEFPLPRVLSVPSRFGRASAVLFALAVLIAPRSLATTTWGVVNSSPDPQQVGSLSYAFQNANANPADSVLFDVNAELDLLSYGTFTGGTTIAQGTMTLALAGSQLADTGALTLAGGTLNLGANHNETVGAVTLGNGSITGTGTSALTGTSYNLGSGTVSVALAGTGAVTKTGSGTATLSGINTYSGGTTLGGGTLSVASDANLGGASTALTFTGGLLQVAGTAIANFGTHVVNYSTFNGGLDVASAANTFTISQGLGGSGSFTKAGAGTLVLSGTNTYAGNTIVSGGTLRASSSLPSTTRLLISNGASVDLDGGSHAITSVGQAGAGNGVVGNLSNGTLSVSDAIYYRNGTTTATFQGTRRLYIGGDSNATVVLNGTNNMTYGDGSQVIIGHGTTGRAGPVTVGNANALAAATQAVEVHSGDLDLNGLSNVRAASIMLLGSQGSNPVSAALYSQSGSASFAGPVQLFGNFNLLGGHGNLTLNGTVSGDSFEKRGNGILTLNGPNTLGGSVDIQAGTLALGSNTALGTGSSDIYFRGGVLQYQPGVTVDYSARFRSYGAEGTQIDTNGQDVTFASTFAQVSVFYKGGAGTLTLTAPQGTTFGDEFGLAVGVGGGTLALRAGDNVFPSDLNLSVEGGGTLDVGASNQAFYTLGVWGGNIVGTGTVTFPGGGTIFNSTITANLASTGTVTIFGNTTLTGTNTFSGTLNTGNTTRIGNGGTTGTLGTGPINIGGTDGVLSFNRSNLITVDNVISGAGKVTQAGSGTLDLTANNTYTGATTVSSGTLRVSGIGRSSSFAIASGAVLEFHLPSGSRDQGANTFISGGGTLVKSGAGTVYWGGGATTFQMAAGSLIDVQGGTLVGGSNANEVWTTNLSNLNVEAGATFWGAEANVRVNALSGSGAIRSGYSSAGYATFTFGVNNGSGTFAGIVADTDTGAGHLGSFTKIGTGTQILTGANTYTGTTSINNGTLAFTGTMTGTGALSVGSGGTLAGTSTLPMPVTVQSGGTVAPGSSGAGTLTLSGAVSLNSGCKLNFDLGTLSDKLAFNGSYTPPAGGTVIVNAAGLAGFGDGTYPLITGAAGISAGSFSLGTMPPGHTYSLTAAAGTLSLIVGPLSVPSGLAAVAGTAQVSLTWNPAENATGYSLKRSTQTGGPYAVIAANVPGPGHADSGLTNGTRYYYVVSALYSGAESPDSGEVSAMPLAPLGPAELLAPTLVRDGNLMHLSTATSSLGRSYQLQRSLTLDGNSWENLGEAIPGTGAGLTFDDSPPAEAEHCFFRILILP